MSPKASHIRRFIKRKLNFNYKRGGARVPKAKQSKFGFMQAIFSVRVLSALLDNVLIINVDETHFGREIKVNQSWLPVGDRYPIINTTFKSSSSMIFALASNGDWIWMCMHGTTNSNDFWIFMMIFRQFVDKWMDLPKIRNIVTLDNAAIHLKKQIRKIAAGLRLELMTLPPYWPQLVLAEFYFWGNEEELAKAMTTMWVNFNKPSGTKSIMTTMHTFGASKYQMMWRKFVSEAMRAISTVYTPENDDQVVRQNA